MIIISGTVLAELREMLDETPALVTSWGSLYISRNVPAACIRLSMPKEAFLRHLLELPGFTLHHKIIPVDGQPFDFVVLGQVTVSGSRMEIGGKPTQVI